MGGPIAVKLRNIVFLLKLMIKSKKFKGNYLILKTVEMNAMHLIVFIKKQLVNFVEELECEQIPTGFMNFIGNKGAIGIGFRLLGSSFLFMNCHFVKIC